MKLICKSCGKSLDKLKKPAIFYNFCPYCGIKLNEICPSCWLKGGQPNKCEDDKCKTNPILV